MFPWEGPVQQKQHAWCVLQQVGAADVLSDSPG